jgi:hypothetical protein
LHIKQPRHWQHLQHQKYQVPWAEKVHALEGLACRKRGARVAYAPRLRLRQSFLRMLWSQNSKS